ncbi:MULTISPECIES: host specificity factor TipJ family phage tail protein [unclassified Halomonas]|uniref:host specificity factor TipJ family phage tail protein n=1 Tax=unclassified Halomonas TaxID=2609666 RepID=UPI002076A6EA|nr:MULTISPECIES: host specificity factor TipJ family phage tail protein [unclassified Halomonas]
MTINVYPSTLPGEPIERHEVSGISLEQWLSENAPGCLEGSGEARPISATVDCRVVPPSEWGALMLEQGIDVDLRVQPQGLEGALLAAVVAGVVATASAFLLKPSIPNVNSRAGSSQGSRLLEVGVQGNQPRLGDVIPDQAGRRKIYPDLLSAPVRRFVNGRSQSLYMLFSLGLGQYQRDVNDLAIGSTPVTSLPGIAFQFFEPGESLAGHQAAENWFNAPEVGASTGASGLRLRGISTQDAEYDASGSSSGNQLTLNNSLPKTWEGEIRLIVNLRQTVTVGGNQASLFGDFTQLSPGILVTISGETLSGIYRVRSVSDLGMLLEDRNSGELIENFPVGDHIVFINRSNVTYSIVDVNEDDRVVTLQRRLSDDSVDPTWSSFPDLSFTQIIARPSDKTAPALYTGPFLACPEREKTSTIEWDVFCPNGLGFINDDGSIGYREREVELQWRAYGTTAWNSIVRTIGGDTRDQLGWTFKETLPSSITPEVRVVRRTLEDTSTQALDKIEWYGLRSQLPQANSYDGVSTMIMVINGSDLIAAQTENQVNLIQTRRLPVWSGSAWMGLEPTRDIAPWIRHIAQTSGYTDDDLDDELIRLDGVWRARGDRYDDVINDSITVKEALNTALRAGMAELSVDHGRIVPVRESTRSQPEHMYTLQNMPGELSRKFTGPRPEDPDGIDVEYVDGETWTTETVECRLPGDQGFRSRKVVLEGVTDRTRAWRIGMRERRRLKYQRWEYSWDTECDGLNSSFKSLCRLADDVPGYGRSAILLDVDERTDGVHLLSSEPFDWSGDEQYVIAWRMPDGTVAGPFPAQRGESDDHVISQMDDVPTIYPGVEPPHLLWGTMQRWSYLAIVEDVEPQGLDSVTLKALNYDARVYADDDAFPPS